MGDDGILLLLLFMVGDAAGRLITVGDCAGRLITVVDIAGPFFTTAAAAGRFCCITMDLEEKGVREKSPSTL